MHTTLELLLNFEYWASASHIFGPQNHPSNAISDAGNNYFVYFIFKLN